MNLNEWLDNPDRKGIPLPVADAIRTALAEVERLRAENQALKTEVERMRAENQDLKTEVERLQAAFSSLIKAMRG